MNSRVMCSRKSYDTSIDTLLKLSTHVPGTPKTQIPKHMQEFRPEITAEDWFGPKNAEFRRQFNSDIEVFTQKSQSKIK